MKFEKTLIPVFAGVDKVKQMIEATNVDETFYISAVRPGIKCLIVNGNVCDENGMPFQNERIQERFKWFCTRLQKSNFIGIGKVVVNSCHHIGGHLLIRVEQEGKEVLVLKATQTWGNIMFQSTEFVDEDILVNPLVGCCQLGSSEFGDGLFTSRMLSFASAQ